MTGLAYNVTKSPKDLKQHPLNLEIYGIEVSDSDLIESIKTKGILEPIVIKEDGTIISGHRRWLAATELKLKTIPCRIISFSDAADEEESLIEYNRQREKIFSQKMKEADHLKKIETAKAKKRESLGGQGKAILPDLKGQTRDVVAEKIGMKPRTFDKASTVWEKAKSGDEVATKLVKELDAKDCTVNKAHNQLKTGALFTSDSNEWCTPKEIVDAVVFVLEKIDLDPCSNSKENPNVPAKNHFVTEDNGLTKEWAGKVYMNPPYGREIQDWVQKLVDEFQENTTEAIALVPARTDTVWFALLNDFVWCAVKGRLKFSNYPDAAPFPSAIFYLGENFGRFYEGFSTFGTIYRKINEDDAR
jgi:phage N-6-adenine-methyltransferase